MTNPLAQSLKFTDFNPGENNELIIVDVGDNRFLVRVHGAVNIYEKKENSFQPTLETREIDLFVDTMLINHYHQRTVTYSRFSCDNQAFIDEIAFDLLRNGPLTVINPELLMQESKPGRLYASKFHPFPQLWNIKQIFKICLRALSSESESSLSGTP